jgi:hypothetical protein
VPPSVAVEALREVGTIPNPPGSGGRDGGYSQRFGGASVWIFGDTFFMDRAADGYTWRASSWSWTGDTDASDGLSGWTHALGADGKPRQLIPHTPQEQAFDDAHNGSPCPAMQDCGARHTAWPAAWVVDPADGTALVFYTEEHTEPTGSYAFTETGASIARWSSVDQPTVRPSVQPTAPDPTVLFGPDEPSWGAAALLVDGDLYAYASVLGGCFVARVPLHQALDRSAWRFFTGDAWSKDWHDVSVIFDCAPQMTIHKSAWLDRYVAFYMVPLGQQMALRVADRPEGPWSEALIFGEGEPPLDGNWDYGLVAHHELARDVDKIEYLSYFQPGRFLDGTVHLLELTFR